MESENETVADICEFIDAMPAKMEGHNSEGELLVLDMKILKRRLQDAYKREVVVAKMETTTGNNAKMREALERVFYIVRMFDDINEVRRRVKMVKSALAAPPRNCDRFASAEEAWDAYDEWVASYRAKGKTEPLNEYGWLFAEAKEGGAE